MESPDNQVWGLNNKGIIVIHTPSALIDSLFVWPLGNGLGKQLMLHVEGKAKKAGHSKIQLIVWMHNPAVNFYKHLGYTDNGQRKNDPIIGPVRNVDFYCAGYEKIL